MRQSSIRTKKRVTAWQLHNYRATNRGIERSRPIQMQRCKEASGLVQESNYACNELNAQCRAESQEDKLPCVRPIAERNDEDENEQHMQRDIERGAPISRPKNTKENQDAEDGRQDKGIGKLEMGC